MLLDLNLDELKKYCIDLGQPKFRAQQLFDAMISGKRIDEISNLPKSFLSQIESDYPTFKMVEKLSAKDGTSKYLFEMNDGALVESVLINHNYGRSVCVSTQVGCRMGCKFCASTLNGLKRNLTAGEILSQVIYINREQGGDSKKRAVNTLVLMGMGEPLDNYDEVTKFLRLVSSSDSLNISQRNITLSTCGLVNEIRKLADEGYFVTLAISLHATSDEQRKKIMPIANKYSISEILSACKYYFEKTGRRISFEFSLIAGENDSMENADKLALLLKGLPCHVNVIPLNSVKERALQGTSIKRAYAFVNRLNNNGVNATKRRSMGEEIGGACGQLRNRKMQS